MSKDGVFVVPPAIVIAVAAVGVYAGYKWLQRESTRAGQKATFQTRKKTPERPVNRGDLRLDKNRGVYRPARSSDR